MGHGIRILDPGFAYKKTPVRFKWVTAQPQGRHHGRPRPGPIEPHSLQPATSAIVLYTGHSCPLILDLTASSPRQHSRLSRCVPGSHQVLDSLPIMPRVDYGHVNTEE